MTPGYVQTGEPTSMNSKQFIILTLGEEFATSETKIQMRSQEKFQNYAIVYYKF